MHGVQRDPSSRLLIKQTKKISEFFNIFKHYVIELKKYIRNILMFTRKKKLIKMT